jgi:protein-disulfide isomerase
MKSQYVLPLTIVVAGLLIAGAVFLVGKNGTPTTPANGSQQATNFRPVDSTDHTLGSPNAAVQVIEYADLECPYCQQFETTMHQVMDYYGQSGQVSWTYRPFPLAQIHSKAPEEAQAAECAAEQGGNTAFFNYIDQIYKNSPLENGLDLTQLPVFAQNIGLNVTAFNTCLSSGKYAQKVQDSYNEAIKEGGTGTPFILITKAGSTDALVLEGAQPYDSMRAAIDQLLGSAAPTSAASSTTPAPTTTQ